MTLDAAIGVQLGSLALDVEVEVAPGELLAILGPNGSGKSTVLRTLAGLLEIDAGRIAVDGTVLDDPAHGVFVPPDRQSQAQWLLKQAHVTEKELTFLAVGELESPPEGESR